MKAFIRDIYGGPDVLRLDEIERPTVKEGHILVKVVANSANPVDWHILRGNPFFARLTYGLFKPKNKTLGADFSGIVEDIGDNVSLFDIGDCVFGSTLKGGAFAEYISVPAKACGLIPDEVDSTEMACVPIAGITALQALVKHGQLEKGETVLINGAAGGVGHFAVQIAKTFGATVTATCSKKNMVFVEGLGADEAIAYDEYDIHKHNVKYDLVIDVHGNLSYQDYKRMGHRAVMVGFTSMKNMASVLLRASIGSLSIKHFTADLNTTDLEILASLVQSGKIKTHIEKTFSYREIPKAIAHIEEMRTRGKVGMVW